MIWTDERLGAVVDRIDEARRRRFRARGRRLRAIVGRRADANKGLAPVVGGRLNGRFVGCILASGTRRRSSESRRLRMNRGIVVLDAWSGRLDARPLAQFE